MTLSQHLSSHIKKLYYGGNYAGSNVTQQLKGLTWEQANIEIDGCNSIVTLVYHCHYYLNSVQQVLDGKELIGSDAESFRHPALTSKKAWETFQQTIFMEANDFAESVAGLSEEQLWNVFVKEEYGTFYRNIQGVIEHTHYHLGQIALLKKMLIGGDYK